MARARYDSSSPRRPAVPGRLLRPGPAVRRRGCRPARRRSCSPSCASRSCATPATSATPGASPARCSASTEDELHGWGHMIRKPPRPGTRRRGTRTRRTGTPSRLPRRRRCGCRSTTSTVENGCMHFIPGSHRGEVLAHRHIGDDPAVHGLETERRRRHRRAVRRAARRRRRDVPPPAHAPLHRGPTAPSADRRAYANEFQTQPVRACRAASRPWVAEGRRRGTSGP